MSQYTIFSIGDSAITFDMGNLISESINQKIIAMQDWLQQHPFDGLKDVVIAYSSLAVVYDTALVKSKGKPGNTVYDFVSEKLIDAYHASVITPAEKKLIYIPVCYDPAYGPDLELIAREKQISTGEIIRLHADTSYRVHMIGFLPGFPYMAPVDERIGLGRKDKPRPLVAAGSVGLAGLQTGVYSLDSPGGWNIIGRTPVKFFDKAKENFCRVKAGDYVQFYAISTNEYDKLLNFKPHIAYY